MKKAWKIFCLAALVCLVLGIILIAAGFFMGSSPSVISSHGSLEEYFARLRLNGQTFVSDLRSLLG